MSTRRDVLGGLAAGAVGLAGCSLPANPLSPAPTPPEYADWLHRPAVASYVGGVEEDASQRFAFGYARPSRVLARTDDLVAEAGDRWRDGAVVAHYLDRRDLGLVSPEEVDRWIRMTASAPADDPAGVVDVRGAMAGSFDVAAVERRTLGTAPRDVGTHRGHDLLRWPDRNVAVAVGDGRVLRAVARPVAPDALDRPVEDALRAVVDVLAGARRPAHEAGGDLAALTGHLGDGLAVRGTLPAGSRFDGLDGLAGWGACSVAVEDLRQRWVGVFEGSVPVDAVERRLRGGYFIGMDEFDRRGRAAVGAGTVDLPVWLA